MQGRHSATARPQSTPYQRSRVLAGARILALAAQCALVAACSTGPEVVIRTPEKAIRVRVELALTADQQQRGLMFRQSLSADSGMLFVFQETEIHSFWMKNTPLPLDMIFIDEDNEIVGIVENAVPFSTNSRMVPRPSRYVLEVNGGFAAANGVKSGQTISLPPIPVSK